jgi:hypothetical protein
MNFFCTKKHYAEWRQGAGSNPDIYGLPLAEAVAVARVLFGPAEDRG